MKFSRTLPSFQYGSRLRPTRDWLLLLSIGGLLLVTCLLWSFWLFERVVNGAVLGTGFVSTPSALSTASLEVIETVFAARAEEFQKFQSGRYTFVDPSR